MLQVSTVLLSGKIFSLVLGETPLVVLPDGEPALGGPSLVLSAIHPSTRRLDAVW